MNDILGAIGDWFVAVFGGLFANGYLGYVVKAFFQNGGRRCWIVRVEGAAASIAGAALPARGGGPVWRVEAESSGAWGNRLGVRLVEVRRVARRALRLAIQADHAELLDQFAEPRRLLAVNARTQDDHYPLAPLPVCL